MMEKIIYGMEKKIYLKEEALHSMVDPTSASPQRGSYIVDENHCRIKKFKR